MEKNQNIYTNAQESPTTNNNLTSVNPQPITPPKKSMFKSKEFLIVFVICTFLVLCFISFISYFGINIYRNMTGIEPINTFTLPTPDSTPAINPTKNWKTHENPMYNYSIKYPGNWSEEYRCRNRSKATDECTLFEQIFKSYPYKEIEQSIPEDANGLIVMIRNVSNPNKLSAKEYASKRELGSYYPISDKKIGSNTFVKVDSSDEGPRTATYYIEDSNGNLLEIFGTITAKNFDYEKMPISEYNNYLDTYNKILSTFEFTN